MPQSQLSRILLNGADGVQALTVRVSSRLSVKLSTSKETGMMRRALPALGILAGGLVHFLIPVGAFGAHDTVVRAGIVGIVSGVTAMLIFILID
jgi:hypothetical protein